MVLGGKHEEITLVAVPETRHNEKKGIASMLRPSRTLIAFIVLVLLIVWCSLELSACDTCVAQQKAEIAASRNLRRHVGGSMGTAKFEGVGWGPTERSAVTNCCYWGRRQPTGIGVARSRRGQYYACVLYR